MMEQAQACKPTITIYYDGWCKLCAGVVGSLARFDKAGVIRMVPLQNLDAGMKTGKEACLAKQSLNMDEVIVVKGDCVFTGAYGVIEVLKVLGGFAMFMGFVLSIFPHFIINGVYWFVARHRYRLFGKLKCSLP